MQNGSFPLGNIKDQGQILRFATRLWSWAHWHLPWYPSRGQAFSHRRHQPLSQSGRLYQRLESPDKSQYTECFPAKWKTLTRLWERFPQGTSPSRFWWRLGDSLDIYPTWVGSNIIVHYYGDVWNAPVVQTSIPDGYHLLNQFNNLITKENAPLLWAVLLHLHTILLQKLP